MADAEIDIGANIKEFSETLQRMEKQLGKVADGGVAKLARLGQAFNALGMAAGAIKGIAGGIIDAAKAVIAPAAAAEKLSVSFRVMLGSETEALRFMDRLNDYAAKTPFELNEISEAAKVMLANTAMGAEEVMTQLEKIGNVSALTGKSMVELSQIYAKAMNVGVTNEVAEQFETAGIGIRREIAEMLGISYQQVFDMISKKQIMAEDLNNALELLTTMGGKFDKGTEQLAETFDGLYSTLEDNVNIALREFGDELLPHIKPIIEKLTAAVDAALPSIENLGAAFGDWFGDAVQNDVLPGIDELILRLPEIGIWLEYAFNKAVEFGEQIGRIVDMVDFTGNDDFELQQTAKANVSREHGHGFGDVMWNEFFGGPEEYEKAWRAELERLKRARTPEGALDKRMKQWEEYKQEAIARQKRRQQERFEQANARDALRARIREENEARRKAFREEARRDHARRLAARKAEQDKLALQKENEKALENYRDRMRARERKEQEKAYDELSIGKQRRALKQQARELGVQGEINPDSIRARLEALAAAGAKSNEQEIAALERLLDAWGALTDRKKEYYEQRRDAAVEMRIGLLEAAGKQQAADKLRAQADLDRRVKELQGKGASEAQARQQATLEAQIEQAKQQRERMQNARVEFVQGHLAAEGGGGASFRIGGSQLDESKQHTRLLKSIDRGLKEFERKNAAAPTAVLG